MGYEFVPNGSEKRVEETESQISFREEEGESRTGEVKAAITKEGLSGFTMSH